MKQNGHVLLLVIVALTLLAGAAFVIHSPVTQPLLEHIHDDIHGAMHGTPAESSAESDATARALAGVVSIGARWDAAAFAETVSLYTAVHRELEWPGLLDPETISYGPNEQQNFDLFRPEQEFSEPGPVFIFVHGNGLGAADWRIPDSEGLLLTHAGRLGATAGGIGVLMNYRTGDAASAFSGAEDLRLVVEWIKANIAPYGGDPDTIVVIGNSEGATHVATYLFDEASQPDTGPGLAAVILSSGLFGDAAPHLAALVDEYRGDRVPLALWNAEFDTEPVRENIVAFHERLCEKFGDCPSLEQLDGYNHVSQLFSLGTDDSTVMNAFIRFYHTVR